MSLLQFVRILIARRWIILVSLVTCVFVAMGVALLLAPRYPAHARIILDTIKPDPVTGQVIANQAMRGYVATQSQLIQDYRVAGEVVDKLGWANNPAVVAQYQADSDGSVDLRRWAAQRIIDQTSVSLVEGSNILEINYQGPTPEAAKAIVNALRDAFIDSSLRLKTDSAGRTAEWYREQADKAQKTLAIAEAAKSKFEADNGIVAAAAGGDAETAKLQALQSALLQARSGIGARDLQASQTAAANGGIVDQLKMQVATLDDQLTQASEKLGPSNPQYKALMARKALLATQLSRESAAARTAGALVSGSTKRSIASIESDYAAQKAKVLSMKPLLDQDAQFQRDVELRRDQYQKAAARTADLKLEADVSEAGLVILGDAISDKKSSWPKIPLIGALSVVFGLGLGLALALTTELLARRVRGAEDLANASKVPVLAVIAAARRSRFRERIRNLLSRSNRSSAPQWQPAQ